MKLENQVCSLELAKRLRELGVNKESFIRYYSYDGIEYELIYGIWHSIFHLSDQLNAYTASELLNMLPQWINTGKDEPFNNFRFRLEKVNICTGNTLESLSPHFVCNYYCDSTECSGDNAFFQRKIIPKSFYDENPCNALAKIYIYLLENGLIKND